MDVNTMKEYFKIHLISLEQDRLNTDYRFTGDQCLELNGQINAIRHVLEVIDEH